MGFWWFLGFWVARFWDVKRFKSLKVCWWLVILIGAARWIWQSCKVRGTVGTVHRWYCWGGLVLSSWIVQYPDQNTSEHIDSNGFDDVFICFFSHDTVTPFESCCSCCRSHSLVGNWMSTTILIRMRLGLICSRYWSCRLCPSLHVLHGIEATWNNTLL